MMGRTYRRFLRPAASGLLALCLAVPSGACGRKVLRSADVASGDYYTEEEFRHLSEDQREEYCDELATELDLQTGRKDAAERRRTEAAKQVQAAPARESALLAEIARLEAEIGDRPAEQGAAGSRYAARPGDSLWRIAARTWGDGRRWREIYDANRDRLRDPDLLPVGTELTVPGSGGFAAPGKGGS